ncbi:hypothetical protein [Aquimonas sp.]|jgi:transcriptional regulator GlxA family with amidase domain|uniref:hypothetical protein n=1 Tax=Aquimonas sp. TaxID=1872588 RepID=UPI0037BFF7F6
MLVFPGGQSLDSPGPLEVFAVVSRQAQDDVAEAGPRYRTLLIGARPGPVRMASGLRLVADPGIDEIDGSGIHTLPVSAGIGDALDRQHAQREVVDWLRGAGAWMLAESGLLQGR